MCGITGFLDYSASTNNPNSASLMTDALAHRGPDGTGVVTFDNVTLGHRRLSIIDREGGHQPMSSRDNYIHLTYNGEIYNFHELRKELQKKGHQFRTSSDTEVVLNAYQAWGRHCVEKFEGMFAFAILDLTRRELVLARDHFGVKPLIYRQLPGNFAFASEFSALKTLPDWKSEIDLYAIDLFLRYQYIPAPYTAFRNVFKLPAGHRMVVGIDEPRVVIERYWKPDFTKKKRRSREQLLEELDECLRDSVRRHLVSDVPFGAFLSGGIDSSLIVSYMAELLEQPVKTFSIGFDDSRFSEVDYARRIASKYNTEHHEHILGADAFESLPDVVRHHGEPFGDQSAIATWALCKLARQHVPMTLSGDGGDELFAGYSTYGGWKATAPRQKDKNPSSKAIAAARRVRNFMIGKRSRIAKSSEVDLSHWFPLTGRFFQNELRSNLWRSDLRFVSDLPDLSFIQSWKKAESLTRINQAQFLDLQTFLPEDILTKVDIASMSVGLETRPPIIDRRVFELAASIPEQDLFLFENNYCGKLPLKRLVERKIGSDFAFRRKQGFEIPLEKWLRGTEDRRNQLEDTLTDQSTGLGQWFCIETVKSTVRTGSAYNLWLLVVLQEWLRQNNL
jgi:asparagine synthase (glutamine-hydrolysing)